MSLSSRCFYIIVFTHFLAIVVWAKTDTPPCTTYTFTDSNNFSVHWKYFFHFKDTLNSNTINTLQNSTDRIRYTRFPSGAPAVSYKPYTHWIRFCAYNPCNKAIRGTLVFDDANICDLTFFHVRPDTTIICSTGIRYEYRHRDINDIRFAFNCLFPPQSTSTIYLKCIGGTYMGLPISLTDNDTFRSNIDKRNLSDGLVYGVILFFGISALFLSIIYRDMNNLYFALFILFYSFMLTIRDGLSYRYLWPSYPLVQQHIFVIAFAVSSIASILFSARFLGAKLYFKPAARIGYAIIGSWLLTVLFSFIGPRYISGLILNPMIVVTVTYIPFLAFFTYRHQDNASRFYIYIWSIFIVIVLLRALFFTFAIQGPPPLMHFFHTGYNQHYVLVFVALFTSLAIGLRVRAMQTERNAAKLEASVLRQKTLELQLTSLQTRIQPHFLFNILNNIANLIVVDAKKAEDAVVGLSTFYRTILKHVMNNMITIEKEIDIVLQYLNLEKMRFGKRIEYSFAIEEACKTVKIPSMAIQVLVENCLKHGIHPKLEGGSVNVTVKKIGDRCEITVDDTGAGLTNAKSNCGTGLKTLRGRLDLTYHNDYIIDLKDKASLQNPDTTGVVVTMNIPFSSNGGSQSIDK